MRGDVETVRYKGRWVNRIQGRYRSRSEATAARYRVRSTYASLQLGLIKVRGKWVYQCTRTFATQLDASFQGQHLARILKVEWFLKSRLGRIRERNTYTGHDPRKTKG